MEASQLESLVDEAPAVSFPLGFGDDPFTSFLGYLGYLGFDP